jgi:hypothetical protein
MKGKTRRRIEKQAKAGLAKLGQFNKWKEQRKAQTQYRLEVSRTWKGERRTCSVCHEEYSCEFFGVMLVSAFKGIEKVCGSVCFGCLGNDSLVRSRLHVEEVPKLYDVLQMIEDREKTWSDRNKKG